MTSRHKGRMPRQHYSRLDGHRSTLTDLRDALAKYRTVLPEFAGRCNKEVWPKVGEKTARGICIQHLGLLLASIQGKAAVEAAYSALGIKTVSFLLDIDRQVGITKELLAKYPI